MDNDNGHYIVQQFEQDIAKVAQTWQSIVNEDPRMFMDDEEWEREKSLDLLAAKGMAAVE